MRETIRRLTLGLLLAVVTTVTVGDEVATEPNLRRGSRALVIDQGELGWTPVHVPRTPATGVVLMLHDADARPAMPVIDALAASTVVVQINADAWDVAEDATCREIGHVLAAVARRSQREAGLTMYHRPVVAGSGRAADLARDLVAAADPYLLPRGVGTAAVAEAPSSRCRTEVDALQSGSRWSAVVSAALPSAVALAVDEVANARPATSSPLDRWLGNFQLPLAAVWAEQPRAALVLISDEAGLLTDDTRLARALADVGVSVVSVDALRYFWQRRSPRDVAFEVRRLASALASTGLPVMVGGVGFGAETMAVTARLVEGDDLAALVLIEPGPTAFFEVEAPLPGQLSLIRPDWSTPDAVARMALPTLCASGQSGRDQYLCQSLGASRYVATGIVARAGEPGREAAIAALVDDFVTDHVPMKVPRRPSWTR